MSAQRQQLLPEVTGPDEDLLCRKFADSRLAVGQEVLNSFNEYIDQGIQECFNQHPFPISDSGDAVARIIMQPIIHKPHYINADGILTPLTKEIAELERRDYTVPIPIKVAITQGGHTAISKKTEMLFEQCVMVYSKVCHDHDKIKEEIENPKNPGCYFFLDGIKAIPMFDMMRQNQLVVATDIATGLPYTYHLSETTRSTSRTNCRYVYDEKGKLVIGITLNKSEFSVIESTVDDDEEGDEDDMVAASSFKKPTVRPPVNALSVLYALLYVASPKANSYLDPVEGLTLQAVSERVEGMLRNIIPASSYLDCMTKFIPTRIAFMSSKHADVISNAVSSLDMTEKGEQRTTLSRMRNYFTTKMLPNILEFEDKVNTIIVLMSYLLQRIVDPLEKDTDKDHWGHKGLSRPREILSASLANKLSKMYDAVEKSKQIRPGMSPDDLLELITNKQAIKYDMTKMLQKDFKPPMQGAFGKEGKGRPTFAIDVIPNNANDLASVIGKIRNKVDSNTPSFSARNVHPSSYKITCPYKFTENEWVGIHKFASYMLHVSSKSDEKVIRNTLTSLRSFGGSTCRIVSKERTSTRTVPVLLNGCFIGYTNIDTGYRNLRMYKRYGIIDNKCCIVKTSKGTIEVYCDSRRVLSPVMCTSQPGVLRIAPVRKEGDPLSKEDLDKLTWRSMTLGELVNRGYIEYLDAYEVENPDIVLAQTFASFDNYHIEKQNMQDNLNRVILAIKTSTDKAALDLNNIALTNIKRELDIIVKYPYTHCSLHPAGAYSLGAANLPFGNHQMTCRTGYASKFEEQRITKPIGDFHTHATGFISAFNTTMMVASSLTNITKRNEMIAGQTLIIAMKSVYENQDDACVVSSAAKDKLFKFLTVTVIRESIEEGEYFGRYNKGENPYNMRHIRENGLPTVGVPYYEGDVVLGKYSYEYTEKGEKRVVDRSYRLANDEVGVVTEVVTYYSKTTKTRGGKLTVSIRISLYTSLGRAGKVSTPHAQKYETALILPETDMPFNERGSIDVMFSPTCFPTRMTYGTVAEPILGRASALSGQVYDMAVHKDHRVLDATKVLQRNGFAYHGEQVYKDGRTGRSMNLRIFSGPANVSMLIHVAIKKTQASPGLGSKHKLTNQVESTRTSDKGQKFGGPERNKTLQYGASFVISERMNISSDGVTMVVCKQCSSWVNFNPALGKFHCTNCDQSNVGKSSNERFGKYIMPQTSIYLQAGLRSIGVEMETKFVSREEHLGEYNSY